MSGLAIRDCRHCRKEIRYSSITGWTHTATKSAFCGADGEWKAVPKRIAEPR